MNNLIAKDKIYVIRNKQVMLDMYFQLTSEEFSNLKSQFVTSSLDSYGGKRKLPYVFTKEGIQILSNILRGKM